MYKEEEIGLASFLSQVRSELETAREHLAESGKGALLNLSEAEIEISFGVKREFDAKGEVKLYVFAIGAGGKHTAEQTHRLKLKLSPAGGDPFAVAG